MILQTEIKIQPLGQAITYGDGLLFLGSCFADEVGNLCKGMGFNALVNPFGELYNPASIEQSVKRLHSGLPFQRDDIIEVGEGYYCTFSHNTSFWQHSEAALLEMVNQSLERAHNHFLQARWIIVSLGTSWVFRNRDTGKVVSNCHKLPSRKFERVFMTVAQTTDLLSEIVEKHQHKNFVFTVSPLRHLKDGLHGNQLSKAALLLSADEVCKCFDNAYYFPAYEIMLDELRDYRFYKEDMVHPTEQAVRHIWEKFVDFAVDQRERPAMKAAAELKQMLRHKPLFPESETYDKFKAQKSKKAEELMRDFPEIHIENLI